MLLRLGTQNGDVGALEACAGSAMACVYSSSDEFEAELVARRRAAGIYGPRRHRPVLTASAAILAALLVLYFVI
jgi:hypothetical protein